MFNFPKFKNEQEQKSLFEKNEQDLLTLFFKKNGFREIVNFIENFDINNPETHHHVLNNYNHNFVHLLNEEVFENKKKELIDKFQLILQKFNLKVSYYDNGIGSDSMCVVTRDC